MTTTDALHAPSATVAPDDADWWRTAVVYQVYPRSFADANGDGVGDLTGVLSRLGYLRWLGVDAIWLSPFYPSPQADGGYDISDYRNIDPTLGELADFDRLVARAHELGIKVIVDIVPNHTSDQHPWFQEAVQSPPGAPARDRYIIRNGRGDGGTEPPADWLSHFGGSAWDQLPDGQWYCHLFAPEQPDLNWGNPEVRQYFVDTLRFWADRGVDGFRIDVAHSLAKDLSEPLRSQPNLDARLPTDGTDALYDREEVHTIYQEWRRVFEEYTPAKMAVAETWHPISDRTFLYARPTELGQVFDFSLLKSGWDRDSFRRVIERTITSHDAVRATPTWVLSSHDVPRHASRLALPTDADPDRWTASAGTDPIIDSAVGLRRARAATLMMLALPGAAYLYQGEELGLPEVPDLPIAALQDPIWKRTGGRLRGRDGCRVPLPWTGSGPSYGFGDNGAWLPQPEQFAAKSVESQQHTPESTLVMYRTALKLRHDLPELRTTELQFDDDLPTGVLSYTRSDGFRCTTNFTDQPITLPEGRVILSSAPVVDGQLPAESAAWQL